MTRAFNSANITIKKHQKKKRISYTLFFRTTAKSIQREEQFPWQYLQLNVSKRYANKSTSSFLLLFSVLFPLSLLSFFSPFFLFFSSSFFISLRGPWLIQLEEDCRAKTQQHNGASSKQWTQLEVLSCTRIDLNDTADSVIIR